MKPIIFNSEMVRAILDGRKTVTRRVVKPQPVNTVDRIVKERYRKPYHPGDVLYVRETWQNLSIIGKGFGYGYKADDKFSNIPWRSSIHMPKEAARIFLRVTDVRVERLKDMGANGAWAEGFTDWNDVVRVWNRAVKPSDRDKYGWDANPWVWVISFERIGKKEAGA